MKHRAKFMASKGAVVGQDSENVNPTGGKMLAKKRSGPNDDPGDNDLSTSKMNMKEDQGGGGESGCGCGHGRGRCCGHGGVTSSTRPCKHTHGEESPLPEFSG
jgi:hypothetical protein